MLLKWLPTRWGLSTLEVLILLVVITFIVAKAWPTSGVAIWLTQGWNLAGAVLQWFFVAGIGQLLHAFTH